VVYHVPREDPRRVGAEAGLPEWDEEAMKEPKIVMWRQGYERGAQIECCGYFTFIRDYCGHCWRGFPRELIRKRDFIDALDSRNEHPRPDDSLNRM
jgi:hypothetical protein